MFVCAAVGCCDGGTHSHAGRAQQGGAGCVLRLRRAAHCNGLSWWWVRAAPAGGTAAAASNTFGLSLCLCFEWSLMKRRTWFKTIHQANQKLGIKLEKFSPVTKFLYFYQLHVSFPFNFKIGRKYFTCGWKYILNVYVNSFWGRWFGGSDLDLNAEYSWNFTGGFASRLF